MPQVYRLSRAGIRLIYKIRHHRGHGIHSPFVFDLITKVIEEKASYYAYSDIKHYLELFPEVNYVNERRFRLLFKLVNYFSPQNILELGAGTGVSTLYLTAPSSSITCMSLEQDNTKSQLAQKLYKDWQRTIVQVYDVFPELDRKQDCIVINLKSYSADVDRLIFYVLNLIHEKSFVIIDGIRTNRKYQMLWKELLKKEEVVVSLDLYHIGILFFNKKYFKKNYKLSF